MEQATCPHGEKRAGNIDQGAPPLRLPGGREGMNHGASVPATRNSSVPVRWPEVYANRLLIVADRDPEGGDFDDDLAALGPDGLAARLAPLLGPGP